MPNVKLDFSLWLPLIALVLGGIAHALSADEGRSLCEKVGLPPLPRKLLPWLVMLFGVGAGMTNSMVLGMGVQQSLIGALAAMATSTFGLSATRITHDTIGGGGGGAGASVVLIAGAFVAAGTLTGCAAFSKAMPFLPKPNDLACVANDVERNVTNPFTIIADCPGLAQAAIADIEALVVDLVAAKRAAHRASAEHAAEACDGGVDAGK